MPQHPLTDRSIFLAAIDIASLAERDAYLARVCGDNAPLRAEVQALLAAHALAGDLLDVPDQVSPTIDQSTERPGTQIGPYKLLQQIGEGGMGVVYMAEQSKPVERRVALKIIKPGMDTRQVIARFEAERQALAMMDHPNIAKVFEAGTTESGRPYFVMELVKGIPITRYCDEKHLSLPERLKLMIPVCQAIQHAHQKGIIHRDIKPTNVLVAQYDGRPVPKVIDFGVAKATAQKLTERTMFTELGQVVGTVEYMSPEQAELNQLDIDTRSDIYSLGVLLYELLAGTTPFDRQKLRSAAFHEMLRIIREDEPPKPSISLSSSGTLASISANRQTDPARLSKAVRGELDWIVMKALEKDRNRRYETANSLASDIQRYLNDEAVQACPPSARYRFQKFARKNRATLTTAAVILLTLTICTLVSTWQAVRATNAETQARANETQAKAAAESARTAKQAETVQRLRAETSEQQANQRLVEVERQRKQAEANFDVALRAVNQLLVRVNDPELNDVPRVGPLRRKILKDAITFYERIPIQSDASESVRLRMADTWGRISNDSWILNEREQARRAHQISIAALEALLADQPGQTEYKTRIARFYEKAGYLYQDDPEAIVKSLRRAIELYADLANSDPQDKTWLIRQALTLNDLARFLHIMDRRDEAMNCSTRAIELLEISKVATPFQRARLLSQAALIRADETERDDLFRRAIAEYRSYINGGKGLKNGDDARGEYGGKLYEIAEKLQHRHPDEAEQLWDESITLWRELCGESTRRNSFFYLTRSLLTQARFLRQRTTSGITNEQPDRIARLVEKADKLLQEALQTQRQMVSRFALTEDQCELVKILQEESAYRFDQVARDPQHAEADSRKLHAVALRDEASGIVAKLDPHTGDEYLARGSVFESLGNMESALADYDKALTAAPANAPEMAQSLRRLAWRLATSTDPKLHDHQRAGVFSKRALQLAPEFRTQGLEWGAAHYRAGNWKPALETLQKALPGRNGGDCADWFLLAMVHWQLGDKTQARQWFDKAEQLMTTRHDSDWPYLRAEAAELLGIKDEPKQEKEPPPKPDEG